MSQAERGTTDLPAHIKSRLRLIDHTIDLLRSVQVTDPGSRWYGGFLDPLRLVAEPWYAAGAVDVMAAALVEPASRHWRSPSVAEALQLALDYVRRRQYPNGTIDAYFVGDMQAAPNVAFVARMLCRAYRKLTATDPLPVDASVPAKLRDFLVRAGAAMVARRPYTSNHRWVMADALLQVNHLFPDPALQARAQSLLDQGIDINEDGMYSERSTSYGMLTNETLLSIGELTGQDRYFDLVARNLEFVLHLLQPNGEDTYQFSTRQDAVVPGTSVGGEDVFRAMARRTGDGRFAAMVDYLAERARTDAAVEQWIAEERAAWRHPIPDGEARFPSLKYSVLGRLTGRGSLLGKWAYIDISDLPRQPLPAAFHRHFRASQLVRVRQGGVAATVMGMQPNFFSLHAGAVVLEGMRIRYLYHNWKTFRPAAFEAVGPSYVLTGSHHRNPERPKFEEDEELELRTELRPDGTAWRVDVAVSGQPMVPVQVEFALRPAGTLVTGSQSVDLHSVPYVFGRGDVIVSDGGASLVFSGLPACEHRIVDHSGGWLGNIPFRSLFVTAFSPCRFTFRIEAKAAA